MNEICLDIKFVTHKMSCHQKVIENDSKGNSKLKLHYLLTKFIFYFEIFIKFTYFSVQMLQKCLLFIISFAEKFKQKKSLKFSLIMHHQRHFLKFREQNLVVPYKNEKGHVRVKRNGDE